MTTQEGVPPDSLVARMIGELNANPEARTLLLRALLTDDFLLLPAKVDRLMDLPAKVDRLQEVRQITTDLAPSKAPTPATRPNAPFAALPASSTAGCRNN